MSNLRFYMLLTLAFGFTLGGLSHPAVVAQESHGQHDHQTMIAEKEISSALATLSSGDRALADAQRFCPIMIYNRLGAKGTPVKLTVEGQPVFLCCEECVDEATNGGAATLEMAQKLTDVSANLARLPADERLDAEAQKFCAIANKNFLGSMGVPAKVQIDDQPVFLCCQGCLKKARANPATTLAKVAELKKAGMHNGHGQHDHQHLGHGDQ